MLLFNTDAYSVFSWLREASREDSQHLLVLIIPETHTLPFPSLPSIHSLHQLRWRVVIKSWRQTRGHLLRWEAGRWGPLQEMQSLAPRAPLNHLQSGKPPDRSQSDISHLCFCLICHVSFIFPRKGDEGETRLFRCKGLIHKTEYFLVSHGECSSTTGPSWWSSPFARKDV